MTTNRAERRRQAKASTPTAADVQHWKLDIDATCCTVIVRFASTGYAVQQHAAGCRQPDHQGVAAIVAGAVADLLGQPVVAELEAIAQ